MVALDLLLYRFIPVCCSSRQIDKHLHHKKIFSEKGCHAMLRLALRDGHKWVVTKFVKEYNHTLMSPSKVPWRGSAKHLVSEDEDNRIRELMIELNNERQRCKRKCVVYQEQLHMLLAYIEEHTNHLSSEVENVVNNLKEVENEQQEDSDCK